MTYTCPDGHTSTAGDYCDVCGAPIGAATASPPAASAAPPMPSASSAPPGSVPASSGPAAGSGSVLDLGTPSDPGAPGPAAAAGPRTCPNCSAENPADALFCEDCGYDFTTGQLPRPLDPPSLTPPTGVAASSPDGAAGSTVLGPAVPGPADPVPPAPVDWVVEVWVDPDWYAAQDAADPCPSPGMPIVVPLREHSILVGRTSSSRNIHPQVDLSADTGVSRRHAQLSTDGQRWWVEDLQSANGTYVGDSGGPVPTAPIAPGRKLELADDERVYLGAWTRLVVRAATSSERGA